MVGTCALCGMVGKVLLEASNCGWLFRNDFAGQLCTDWLLLPFWLFSLGNILDAGPYDLYVSMFWSDSWHDERGGIVATG